MMVEKTLDDIATICRTEVETEDGWTDGYMIEYAPRGNEIPEWQVFKGAKELALFLAGLVEKENNDGQSR